MTENKKLNLLKKLKKISDIYKTCTNEQKIRLFEASYPLIEELSSFGYPPIVSESLLMFGDEFYWKQHLVDDDIEATFKA